MKTKINIDFDSLQKEFDQLNELRKERNEFLELRKIGDTISLQILETGKEIAKLNDTFGNLFSYRDNYKCKIDFDTKELEVFTSTALHTHSEYSILDGANRLKDLANKYAYSGALTDHGVMYGFIDFYKKMKAVYKKPIIGFEAYTKNIDNEEKKHHLIILAKNDEGLKNAMKLCSAGNMHPSSGKVPRPIVSYEELKQYHEGLIVLSACIAGEVPQLIIEGNDEKLKSVIRFYKDTFGEDYYFEIQRHASKEEIQKAIDETNLGISVEDAIDEYGKIPKELYVYKYSKHIYRNVELYVCENLVNEKILELSKEFGVKVVATTDAHYLNADDNYMHEALLCNQTKTVLSNPDRFRFAGTNYHVHTISEMEKLYHDLPETLINTLEIEDKCDVTVEFGNYKLPKFPIPEGYTDKTYLEKLVWDGFEERFGKNVQEFKNIICESDTEIAKKEYKERKERIRFELDTVFRMGYQGYFFIVWDYVQYAKSHGIYLGPGRGSGAGSLVLYCLHITEKLDPLKYDLLFARFLNPDRISMPDIDLDFEFEYREQVINYCRNFYGPECVSRIITFGTMAAKGAIRDMARVLGFEPSFADMIAKLIPNEPKMTIQKAFKQSKEFEELYDTNLDARKVINLARKVEGLIKNTSQHACGVIISSEDISNFCPMTLATDEKTGITALTTQITMGECEEIGLLKFDFLGLRTESVIKQALVDINRIYGLNLDNYDIPINDVNVYKYLSKGNTSGVFQLESDGMTSVIAQLYQDVSERMEGMTEIEKERFGDELFERLVAGISLYRPGPMDEIPHYIEGMLNPKKVIYDTPKLEPILKSTYGVLVYQEEVMLAVQTLAGFSQGQADTIRKGMSKKKDEILNEYKPYFIEGSGRNLDSHTGKPLGIKGCVENGISREVAETIWDKMYNFAKYAFNKSHGAAYAVVSAQTAWLAYYYPIIFMKANLNVYISNPNKLKMYLAFCTRSGIQILAPSVNESEEFFSLNENGTAIRFGLKGIKGLDVISRIIIAERNERGTFTSLENFIHRMIKYQKISSGNLEALIYVGALDEFDGTRKEKIENLDRILEIQKAVSMVNQATIFDLAEEFKITNMDAVQHIELENKEEMSKNDLLEKENEYSGFYISGHPLDDYKLVLDHSDLVHISSLVTDENSDTYVGSNIKIGGMIVNLEKKNTRKGGFLYTFTLRDMSGDINCVCFERSYQKNLGKIQEGSKVSIFGKFDENDFGPQFIVDTITYLDNVSENIVAIDLFSDKDLHTARNQYLELASLVPNDIGNIKLNFLRNGQIQPGIHKGKLSLEFFAQLQNIFGENACKLVYKA